MSDSRHEHPAGRKPLQLVKETPTESKVAKKYTFLDIVGFVVGVTGSVVVILVFLFGWLVAGAAAASWGIVDLINSGANFWAILYLIVGAAILVLGFSTIRKIFF